MQVLNIFISLFIFISLSGISVVKSRVFKRSAKLQLHTFQGLKGPSNLTFILTKASEFSSVGFGWNQWDSTSGYYKNPRFSVKPRNSGLIEGLEHPQDFNMCLVSKI